MYAVTLIPRHPSHGRTGRIGCYGLGLLSGNYKQNPLTWLCSANMDLISVAIDKHESHPSCYTSSCHPVEMQFSLWNLRLLYTFLLQTAVSAHPRRNTFPSWKKNSLVFMANVYLCVRLFILEYVSIHVACTFLKPQWLKFHSWTYPAFPYTYLLCTACVRSFRLFIGIGLFYMIKWKVRLLFSRWKVFLLAVLGWEL